MYYQHKVQTFFSKPSEKVDLESSDSHHMEQPHTHSYRYVKKITDRTVRTPTPHQNEKNNPNIPNEQNNCDFFFSFISAILSHSEKRFLTLYFWRYKCIIMYL